MKKYILILIGLSMVCLFWNDSLQSQTSQNANYVNSLFFSNRLSVVRTSYDRWQSLMNRLDIDYMLTNVKNHNSPDIQKQVLSKSEG
jgi:hypothetical protein